MTAVNRINSKFSVMNGTLTQLFETFAPVLSPESEQKDAVEEKDHKAASDFEDFIFSSIEKMDSIIDRMQDMIQRSAV
jgi:hypothetical protein